MLRSSVFVEKGTRKKNRWGEREALTLFIMVRVWEIVGDVGLTAPTSHSNRSGKRGNCPTKWPHS